MKKLVVILLTLAMVLSMFACAAPATTEEPAAPAAAEAPVAEEAAPVEEAAPIYIPVMSKGFQHQFWQAVKIGAEAAAVDFGVEIYFDGPASETEIDAQVNMVKTEMTKNPKALALAALSTEAVTEILEECVEKGIPVIGFDSGVPDDKTGAVKATASTNNENAAALAAEKFGENADLVAKMQAATPENPLVIGCLSQDAVSASVTGRTTGFVNKMTEIAETYQPGLVSVEGHTKWEAKVDGAAIIIRVEVSATTEATSLQTSANSLLATSGIGALFCSNEGAVVGLLAATADGEDLADGGKYADLVVAGFDAGTAQKNAIRNGWFYGSVTQDPYQIGYKAVELAYKAAMGEAVADVDTGAQWYNATNIDEPAIALLVYD
jgi:ribose transport system substrate-binding protein